MFSKRIHEIIKGVQSPLIVTNFVTINNKE
nr:MAG TPA: hypothetical protein [Caudoviricetes sp.]